MNLKMVVFTYFKVLMIYFVYTSSTKGVHASTKLTSFEKLAEDNVKINSSIDAISASSRLKCCVSCTNTAGCSSINYNALSLHNNCELITSGLPDMSLLTSQLGWNVYVSGSANCTSGSWNDAQVFQRRLDGSVDFYRGWEDYVQGFGQPLCGEFWLGLELIHQISSSDSYELRIDLEDFEGGHFYAEYGSFHIGGADLNYTLYVNSYTGNAGDCFSLYNNVPFTTYDRDNDQYSANCAQLYHGAWWYTACHSSNLNGLYSHVGNVPDFAKNVCWQCLRGYYYSFKKADMKMRKVL